MPESSPDRWSHPAAILVATDLSDLDRLMPFALEQAAQAGARLILLHVIALSEAITADAAGMPYYDPAGALDTAARALEAACQQARKHDIVCDALVREGHAAQQILSAARQFHADRILLGTRSRGKVSRLLIGSVAEQVLRSVHIPVITVGPEAHLPVAGSPPQKVVLHATTLRETSRPSATLASRVASTLAARLILLHVLPPIPEMQRRGEPTGLDSAAMQELRAIAEETSRGCEIAIEPYVVHGNPAIEILAEASGRRAGLIVLGAAHRSAFENLTRDHTVYKVLAHSRCPVMTLREPEALEEAAAATHAATHAG
ncbi:MAG TPA: universal stress protein [Terracidiphilus sp.]|nr:universal stress protein [Terracidiphilus sp.]